MKKRAQGSFEFMMMGLIFIAVGLIISLVALTAQGLGTNLWSEVDNFRDNVIVPGLVGATLGIVFRRR